MVIHEAFSLLDISVQCRELPKSDRMSQTDAFCVLHAVPADTTFKVKKSKKKSGAEPIPIIPKSPEGEEKEVGRTEVVYDTPEPDFTDSFEVEYHFEEQQRFVLRVFDEDSKGKTELKKHDYIGGTTFTLAQLMGARGSTLVKPLGTSGGYVILKGEEQSMCKDVVKFQIQCNDLKNKDGWFDKSDPYLVISRMNEDRQTWNQVWKSEVVNNDLNPNFKPAEVKLSVLCNGDLSRPVRISIFDFDDDGEHDALGTVETTIGDILDRSMGGENRVNFDVMYQKEKHGKTKSVPRGTLTVRYAERAQVPTFADYLAGGCEISLMVAVDFTASNGDPYTPESLHYQDPSGKQNQYQAAIRSIGSILQEYDTDRQFPLWGFGAVVDGQMSHCFQVSDTAEVRGVHGMMDAYSKAFERDVRLSGPTKFGPILQAATDHAIRKGNSTSGQVYSILLILTDGVIHDMYDTIDQLCRAAKDAPMSVIIVGVGDEKFDGMEALDGDEGRLRDSQGKFATRDIVQFVAYRKVADTGTKIASKTLEEIPKQLVDCFTSRNILPMAPQAASGFDGKQVVADLGDYVEEEYHVASMPAP